MRYPTYEITSPGPLPRALQRYSSGDPCKCRLVAFGPRVADFTTDAGLTIRHVDFVERPKVFAPESLLAAIENRQDKTVQTPRPSDADLAAVLDAFVRELKENTPELPAEGADFFLRDLGAFGAGQGIPSSIVARAISERFAVDVEPFEGDSPYTNSFASEAIRRRDELVARKVAETSKAKKEVELAKRPNAKTCRELGVWAFRVRSVLKQPEGFGPVPGLTHAGYTYYFADRFGGLAAYPETFDGGLELVGDDFVLDAAEGRIPKPRGYSSAWIVGLVLKSRAHVDARPIALGEMHDDSTLDPGEWSIALAERVARPWLGTDHAGVCADALVRGLLVEPATAEEVLLAWKRTDDENFARLLAMYPEHNAGHVGQAREGIRTAIAGVMAGGVFEPGELLVKPSSEALNALAISTGRDPIRGLIAKITSGKREVTSDELDEALRAHRPEGTPTTSWFQRVKVAMGFAGFEKKVTKDEANPSGKGRKFVKVDATKPAPAPEPAKGESDDKEGAFQ